MMDYDAWLEQPYWEAADNDAAHEAFQESSEYEEYRDEWLEENGPGATEDDYQDSVSYADAFDDWMEERTAP